MNFPTNFSLAFPPGKWQFTPLVAQDENPEVTFYLSLLITFQVNKYFDSVLYFCPSPNQHILPGQFQFCLLIAFLFTFLASWLSIFSSVQFSSVAQSCPTLCDPMNLSTPAKSYPVSHGNNWIKYSGDSPSFQMEHVFFKGRCQFSSVQTLSRVQLFVTPWIAARQASLSITNSRSSLRLTSIKSVMPSNHLILCRPLLLLPPVPPSIRDYSNESTLCMKWPSIRVSALASVLPMNTKD